MKSELSAREPSVISYAVDGYTDDMTAQQLRIERGAVNCYWVRIGGKLGNLSRTELASRFVQKNADARTPRSWRVASPSSLHGLPQRRFAFESNGEIDRLNQLLAKRSGK